MAAAPKTDDDDDDDTHNVHTHKLNRKERISNAQWSYQTIIIAA